MTPTEKPAPVSLPDKPSELLTVALDDLEKVEKDDRYEVDMDDWHRPTGDGTCSVCLAGCVIARELDIAPADRSSPFKFPDPVGMKLCALDDFRKGWCGEAFISLELDGDEGQSFNRHVTPYWKDPAAFKAELRQLAADLQKAGF